MLLLTLVVLIRIVPGNAAYNFIIPKELMFGAATSSYQSEGAWDTDGKGVNVWDTFMNKYSYLIPDKSDGHVSAISYYKYKEDIQALKAMGMQIYRFSISWPRIMPTGLANNINQRGIDYYNEVIDEVIKNGIIPMVTMYHWDMPQSLQDLGGWANELLVDYFEDYARVLFKNFGDRVKWWITINDPVAITTGYEGPFAYEYTAPFVNSTGIAPYLVGHTLLKAHARAYHLYHDEFRAKQTGKLSLTVNLQWFEPESESSPGDKEAVHRMVEFLYSWFLHPIFSKNGDYPDLMKERIANLSNSYGFTKSRLPSFTIEEIGRIKGTADFAALNIYSPLLINDKPKGPTPSNAQDTGASIVSGLANYTKISPKGIRNAVKMFKENYGDWQIFITESGYPDDGKINDTLRMTYLGTSMVEIMKAMNDDGVRVIGYIVWSLVDLLEWTKGFTVKYGLYHVNFSDPERTRTPKQSARLMKSMIETRRIPYRYIEEDLRLINPPHLPTYSTISRAANQPRRQLRSVETCSPRNPPPQKPEPFISRVLKTVLDWVHNIGEFTTFIKNIFGLDRQ